jgi:hypothetical protein
MYIEDFIRINHQLQLLQQGRRVEHVGISYEEPRPLTNHGQDFFWIP